MGMTSLRRNEEERKRKEARGGSPASPQPSSIPFSQHQAEMDRLRSEYKALIIELKAKTTTAVDVRGVEELTATMLEGHKMLSDAYDALKEGMEENRVLNERVRELQEHNDNGDAQVRELEAKLAASQADVEALLAADKTTAKVEAPVEAPADATKADPGKHGGKPAKK